MMVTGTPDLGGMTRASCVRSAVPASKRPLRSLPFPAASPARRDVGAGVSSRG